MSDLNGGGIDDKRIQFFDGDDLSFLKSGEDGNGVGPGQNMKINLMTT